MPRRPDLIAAVSLVARNVIVDGVIGTFVQPALRGSTLDFAVAEKNIHPRILLRVIVVCTAVATGVTLIRTDDQVLKIIGAVIVVTVLLLWLSSDVIDAWFNERHVDRHPHLLKNEAIGQTVVACGDFKSVAGEARGYVLLKGEKWRATVAGTHLPLDGEQMQVRRREGLILHVQPHAGGSRPSSS